MTKQEFQEFAKKGPIILDGATGSCLQKKGMPYGVCAEKWISEHPEHLIQLQREYVAAGSNVIYSPTFGANAVKLREYGLENEVVEINELLVKATKEAVGDKALVAGDLTLSGQTLEPLGELPLEELIAAYEQQIRVLDQAGVDLLVVETMMSLQETRAALIAAANVSSLPIMVTMTFGEGGRTLYGTDARTAAVVITSLGADAVGMNCSAGPDKMVELVSQMREVTKLPIIAKPNAGMPALGENGETVYDMGAEEFARHMQSIEAAGATFFGGCCGTTPEYIEKMKKQLVGGNVPKESDPESFLASERELVALDQVCYQEMDSRSDEELRDALEDEDFDSIYDLLDEMEDEDRNAVMLCLMGNEDELSVMKQVLPEIIGYSSCPIGFCSENKEVLEYALRNYCGVAAVRVTEGNQEWIGELAKKYGAVCQ